MHILALFCTTVHSKIGVVHVQLPPPRAGHVSSQPALNLPGLPEVFFLMGAAIVQHNSFDRSSGPWVGEGPDP